MKIRGTPQELDLFIAKCIESVHTLEVLLLLFHGRAHTWSAEEVNEQVKSSLSAVKASLLALIDAGLVRPAEGTPDRLHYLPKSPALEEATAKLAVAYTERRTAVIESIYSGPTQAVRRFANAFKFQKDVEL